MTDIVGDCRFEANQAVDGHAEETLRAAADEIERLRDMNERLIKELDSWQAFSFSTGKHKISGFVRVDVDALVREFSGEPSDD